MFESFVRWIPSSRLARRRLLWAMDAGCWQSMSGWVERYSPPSLCSRVTGAATTTTAVGCIRGERSTTRYAMSFVVFLAVAGIASACGGSQQTACVPDAATVGRDGYEGTRATVKVGSIFYVRLDEPVYPEQTPSSFPYLTPTSSMPKVLVRTPLCPSSGPASTLPVRTWAFRAARPGTAKLIAALAPAWRSVKHVPHAYESTVTVVG
jgi:hypothetical protein